MNFLSQRLIIFYFTLSALVLAPATFSLALYGLRLSLDFTGGSLLEIKTKKTTREEFNKKLIPLFKEEQIEILSLQSSGEDSFLIRAEAFSDSQKQKVIKTLEQKFGQIQELRFETVGPTISAEITQKAIIALVLVIFAIVIYVAYAFRTVPKIGHQKSLSLKFGLATIAAMLHDAFLLLGLFSLLGHFYHVEIDALFITATLTVIGYSVHDTIVVFDRLRENLKRHPSQPFRQVANLSLHQTLRRSLFTSLTVVLVLIPLLAFSVETLRWFLLALTVGIISGTYSSIFNATPILVLWVERKS